MCGIAGGIFYKSSIKTRESIAKIMSDAIVYRGPDDAGIWCDEHSPVTLAHRRLSIIDTSNHGHQPMRSSCGRWVIVFNGEIYNYQSISDQLTAEGVQFTSSSDTEVLLEGIARWGVEATLKQCHGMFAFCAYDIQHKKIWIARDRLGEKPLYYGWWNKNFVFASELKAIKAIPDFDAPINRDALALFLRHNYIPTPHSIYTDIHKLEAGVILSFDIEQVDKTQKTVPYWRLKDVIKNRNTAFSANEQQQNFEDCLRQSVKRQLHADVPVGAFLSGGVDSSAIVALMAEASSRPVQTFSIGFDNEAYNEAKYAKEVAQHLGTDHDELYVTSQDALDVVERLPTMYDEPFADSSQMPTFLVMQMAKQHVTVALSGDGGDELFGGYERYRWAEKLWSSMEKSPHWLRRFPSFLTEKIPASLHQHGVITKVQRIAQLIKSPDRESLYRALISHTTQPSDLLLTGTEPIYGLTNTEVDTETYLEYMMAMDTLNYLPDDILTKVDRASMAVSLEVRVPLLDHAVVEAAWNFPHCFYSNANHTKMPIRKVLYQYVPKHLIERPKRGFAVPLAEWLRGPLKEWADNLLQPMRLQQEGYFEAEKITKIWSEHLAGRGNWQYLLWNILMFQRWLAEQ